MAGVWRPRLVERARLRAVQPDPAEILETVAGSRDVFGRGPALLQKDGLGPARVGQDPSVELREQVGWVCTLCDRPGQGGEGCVQGH